MQALLQAQENHRLVVHEQLFDIHQSHQGYDNVSFG